ncbi:Aste57867_19191 [Aphanomyces stellatus]|uniref:Aste57867_19191 protein n=1 Tax=Aphanomyces stellatus TaxID=120398 RepID=A0A485LDF9_9STRA|nr:hypothetical protein As57867_019127 [Aphanomyces stellatus]VFT95913.1 Aste57867_19191 [Aphanomyces stellatus]
MKRSDDVDGKRRSDEYGYHHHMHMKTPADAETAMLQTGALRAGDALVYFSREVLALLSQYVAIGLMLGAFPNLVYPVFTIYFRMSGAQTHGITALTVIGWNLKVFFGILSDCFPILGYRRKSWMVIGWTCCCACLIYLFTYEPGEPYIVDRKYLRLPYSNLTATEKAAVLNEAAPDRGFAIALMCGVAVIAYVVADVAADALFVEMAQREPECVRGRLQSLVYIARYIATVVSQAIIGLCLNSEDFGGTFTWAMPLNYFFLVLAVPCALMVPTTVLFIHEVPKVAGVHFGQYMREFWQLVQNRAMWQYMIFRFAFNFLSSGVVTTAAPFLQYHWAKVSNMNSQLFSIVGNLIFAAGLAYTGTRGTAWNWRTVIVVTNVTINVVDAVANFCTIYDVVRNQYFFLALTQLVENVPSSVQFLVNSFVIVELAEIGNEGITYALLSTMNNLPVAFGPLIGNIVSSQFRVTQNDIITDTAFVRNQVAYTYGIYYFAAFLACFTVYLLPSQKNQVYRLKVYGGKQPLVAAVVLILSFLCLIYSITAALLSLFPGTQCLVIAGGAGCSKKP